MSTTAAATPISDTKLFHMTCMQSLKDAFKHQCTLSVQVEHWSDSRLQNQCPWIWPSAVIMFTHSVSIGLRVRQDAASSSQIVCPKHACEPASEFCIYYVALVINCACNIASLPTPVSSHLRVPTVHFCRSLADMWVPEVHAGSMGQHIKLEHQIQVQLALP